MKMVVLLQEDPLLECSHSAYVTSTTLVDLKVLNATWVRVSLAPKENEKKLSAVCQYFEAFENKKNEYVLQLMVWNEDGKESLDFFSDEEEIEINRVLRNGVIYVSPAAMFNIFQRDINNYRKCRTEECKVDITALVDFSLTDKNNFASNVDICPVFCSFGNLSTERINELMKDYYTEPKVLCQDELFAVSLKGRSKKDVFGPSLVWFSVKSLEQNDERRANIHTNARFVDSRYSNLFLSNQVKSFIPQCPCNYQNNTDLLTLYRNVHFNEAFSECVSQISDLLTILHLKNVKSRDAAILLEGPRGIGKGLIIKSICEKFCCHFHEENCFDIVGDSLGATEKRIYNLFQLASSTTPCVLYLKNVHVLFRDKEGVHEERRTLEWFIKCLEELTNDFPLLLIGGTYCSKEMSPRFYSEFMYHLELEPPTQHQRLCIIKAMTEGITLDANICDDLATKTAGFILSDFIALFTRVRNKNMENVSSMYKDLVYSDSEHKKFSKIVHAFSQDSIECALEELRVLKAGSSASVKIPKVTWDDVGGLQEVKTDILDTIELPIKFPHLFAGGLRRSGLLFYGPPGCGKTLLAKAIATEFTLNFYSVKGPELINMYVGQSEENVREVFKKARGMSPCIIFFDELDSLAPNRGRSGDSGGVMDRIVSQLLAELDGIHDNVDVFVIGATNRPDLLDPALLRPGRFDKMIYVGVAEEKEQKIKILKAVTRKLKLSDDILLEDLVDLCPSNLTGADFYALASDAMMNCYRRLIRQHEENGDKLNPDDAIITSADMNTALENLVPSVSLAELERYRAIREELSNRK